MIAVELANGGVTWIDHYDAMRVLKYQWRRHSEGYATRDGRTDEPRTVYLHRELLGLVGSDGRLQVDHLNRDRLDNRRVNLRVVENRINSQNRRAVSGYRGVHFSTRRSKWIAKVKLDYASRHLGLYDLEVDAARAAEAFIRWHMPASRVDKSLDPLPSCSCTACRRLRGEAVAATAGKRYKQHDERIREQAETGASTAEIATSLGCSTSCVQRSIKRQGLAFTPSRRWESAA